MRTISAPTLLVDGTLVGPGTVVIDGGTIVEVLVGDQGGTVGPDHVRLGSGVLTAGLVDVQINGAYGVDLVSASPAQWRYVAERLPQTGVTSFVPTYTTAPLAELALGLDRAAAARSDLAGRPTGSPARIIGVHLEGPYLSPLHAGAHDRALMLDPSREQIDLLLADDGGRSIVTMVTLAPERTGAIAAIERLVAEGVTVSVGHSAATAAQTAAAADAGARMVTHLFNAQSPLGHREPGLPGHALADERYTLGLIADLQHVSADIVRVVFAAAGHRVALVTDAIAAAGMPPGEFRLGGMAVHVDPAEGLPRLADGTIAGSALQLDAAVRTVVGLGVSPAVALTAATAVPAAVVRRPDLGRIAPGCVADLVWWDQSYVPRRVWIGGEPAQAASS